MTSANPDHHYIGLERVYPCRCGQTHAGQWAFEEWAHHNCYHEGEWCVFPLGDGLHQLICVDCGKTACGYEESAPH